MLQICDNLTLLRLYFIVVAYHFTNKNLLGKREKRIDGYRRNTASERRSEQLKINWSLL